MAEPAVVADAVQVAANDIPLPTWRPNHSLPADLAAADLAPQDKAVLLALADTAGHGKTATDVFSVLPSARPDLPSPQPDLAQPDWPSLDQVQSAAVQSTRSEPSSNGSAQPTNTRSLRSPSQAGLGELAKGNAASPRDAVFARPAGSDPAAAIGTGVKTTRKAAGKPPVT